MADHEPRLALHHLPVLLVQPVHVGVLRPLVDVLEEGGQRVLCALRLALDLSSFVPVGGRQLAYLRNIYIFIYIYIYVCVCVCVCVYVGVWMYIYLLQPSSPSPWTG